MPVTKDKPVQEPKQHKEIASKTFTPATKAKPVQEPKQKPKQVFLIGFRVHHVQYGRGIVKDISGNRIVIEFDDDTIKTFDLKFCIEKKLLKRIKGY